MKILDRHGLMALPIGTVYFPLNVYMECGTLRIKEDTIKGASGENIDWLYYDPCDIDSYDDGERIDRLDAMRDIGVEFPINKSGERDGGFDDNERFLVCSPEDKEYLVNSIIDGSPNMR